VLTLFLLAELHFVHTVFPPNRLQAADNHTSSPCHALEGMEGRTPKEGISRFLWFASGLWGKAQALLAAKMFAIMATWWHIGAKLTLSFCALLFSIVCKVWMWRPQITTRLAVPQWRDLQDCWSLSEMDTRDFSKRVPRSALSQGRDKWTTSYQDSFDKDSLRPYKCFACLFDVIDVLLGLLVSSAIMHAVMLPASNCNPQPEVSFFEAVTYHIEPRR